MVEMMRLSIGALIEYWKKQKFKIIPISMEKITSLENEKGMIIPKDFVDLYTHVNGMRTHYAYDMDKNGFFFYSIYQIVSFEEELGNPLGSEQESIYIFAEYMHKSWWYAFETTKDSYTIGLVPHGKDFIPITNSLSEFINLYLDDSPRLYV